jgi:dTDP-4-dehydrorhamnose reductase
VSAQPAHILITGCNGQVGFELRRALAPLGAITAVDVGDCDLGDEAAVRRTVRAVAPQIIVNPAAYTAVDRAESEPELAQAINARAPQIFAEEAARTGALLVQYSTDYVFDGSSSGFQRESDQPNPINAYGRSKLAGERAVAASGAAFLTLRTSWVIGAHGANFAKTILRLAAQRERLQVVADQWGAPTSAALVADVTAQLLGLYLRTVGATGATGGVNAGPSDFPFGLYHLAAGGETNWHELAQTVVGAARAAGRDLRLAPEAIEAITTAQYPAAARRGPNSRLDTSALRSTFGLVLPDWRVGIAQVLEQILEAA